MSYSKGRRVVTGLVVLFAVMGLQTAQAQKIYWAEEGPDPSISRAGLDGSETEHVITTTATGIAVDPVGRKIYWGSIPYEEGPVTIRRANLDGSNPAILYDLAAIQTSGIDLDHDRGDIYVGLFFFEGCVGITRFDMNGTGDIGDGESIVPDICSSGIAVDSTAGKVYWAEISSPYAIRRANLDGTNIETVTELELDAFPGEIALDKAGGKLYWIQYGTPDIVLRVGLDGSDKETIVSGDPQYRPGLALDPRSGKVFWAFGSAGSGGIRRADLDGSNVETILELGEVGSIDIDPVTNGPDVPAVSSWGVVVAVLLVMVTSAVVLRKRGVGEA